MTVDLKREWPGQMAGHGEVVLIILYALFALGCVLASLIN